MNTLEIPVTAEFAEAALGYCLHVPCINRGCGNDVAWYGIQHGCVEGPLCDDHMVTLAAQADHLLAEYGWVGCKLCGLLFPSWDSFIRIRVI